MLDTVRVTILIRRVPFFDCLLGGEESVEKTGGDHRPLASLCLAQGELPIVLARRLGMAPSFKLFEEPAHMHYMLTPQKGL